MTYEIKNLDSLESTVKELASVNEKIKNNASEVTTILNQIKNSWENDMGNDFASIVQEIQNCVQELDVSITQTVSEYVKTIDLLVEESRRMQNNTL